MENEINRIKDVYKDRSTSPKIDYNPILPQNTYFIISREKILARLLNKYFDSDLSKTQLLDVGFGSGNDILNLLRLGVDIKNVHGVEILPERYNRVKDILINADLKLINGFDLPYQNESIDLLIQSTVFSSILDFSSRKLFADEMYRVLKSSGKIFSYDIRFFNPWNKNVTKIDREELKKLFPKAKITLYPITLNPILVRKIAPYSVLSCELLEKLSFLCSHYYSVIEKI